METGTPANTGPSGSDTPESSELSFGGQLTLVRVGGAFISGFNLSLLQLF